MNNGRWWEFYLVRYFIGTVVGTLIIIYLANKNGSFLAEILIKNNLIVIGKEGITVGNLIFFGFIGLTFCYISSAPVLLIHATRSVFNSIKGNEEVKRWKWILNFLVVLALLIVTIFTLLDLKFSYLSIDKIWPPKTILKNQSGILLLLILLFQLILLFFLMLRRNLFTFYNELITKRSQEDQKIKDYKESYKHLREHGNAFMIVFFEIILGSIYASVPEKNGAELAIKYTLLWIMPACCVWGIGTYLEMKIRKLN